MLKSLVIAAAAAAAKSLQSCLTLCDPIDGSPPGSPNPGILQARTLEWVAISFSNAQKWKVKVKLLSRVRLLVTPWTAAYQAPRPWDFPGKSTGVGCQASLSISNSQNLVKLMFIESMMPSNHPILCHPLLPSSIFPSIRVFSNEPVLRIRWPKYWSFSFSISPSKEYSGFPLELTGLISLQSRDSKESSPMLQFKSINSSALSFLCGPSSHIHTWLLEKP